MRSTFSWWRHSVVYQVYLRSFADGDGDGTGDIAGLRSRLAYLASLGVDAIWVNPWYVSPMHDGGYDVADYKDINPLYGTLEDAKGLIVEAGEAGLRLLVDLVPNHTSSEHPWFRAALEAGPGSPERARYHFLAGKSSHGQDPPNNWRSVFGGPAWSRARDGEWYLHMFDASQPDLNWGNNHVRRDFEEILRYWLDLGASGFRVDVAHALVKAAGYPDSEEAGEEMLAMRTDDDHPLWDRPELHEVVREWRAVVDEYDDTVMIAEAWLSNWERLAKYLRPGEYHQTFDFNFLQAPWDRETFKGAIDTAIEATREVGSIPTWVLSNHDVVRHVTRYGLPADINAKRWLLNGDRALLDVDRGRRRARAAALLMFALPGSAYLYQGEELGLHEVHDLPEGVLDDPIWERSGHTAKGRDGCRVPIPWTPQGSSYGFGDNGAWLPQPDAWAELSVESQEGVEGSMLELYRSALAIRSAKLRDDESLEWLDLGPEVLAFRRGDGTVCLVNFGRRPVDLPDGEALISSGALSAGKVPTDTAVWVSAG